MCVKGVAWAANYRDTQTAQLHKAGQSLTKGNSLDPL